MKSNASRDCETVLPVSALAAEWIEIIRRRYLIEKESVSALAAEWIEIRKTGGMLIGNAVSALAAEWIEIE